MDPSTRKVLVRPNVTCEPLINRWYAWPYLIPPATASLYVANHHLRIMQSFVNAPQLHVQALKRADMAGGPFIGHDAGKTPQIAALIQETRKRQAHLLELAEALKALTALLSAEATGSSLEPLYAKVPDILKGYVELVYDIHHRAYFRVIEPLLYRSRLYGDATHAYALSLQSGDTRAFALSTPRLEEPGTVFVEKPFTGEAIDVLSRARRTPVAFADLKAALGLESDAALEPFVSDEAPAPPAPSGDSGPRVRYFGHACILAEANGVSVLFDPLVAHKYEGCSPRYGFDDLPERIDYVVITHSHQDHALLETLLQLRHRVGQVIVPSSQRGSLADPSLMLALRQVGFPSVRCIDELETVEFQGGSLTALPFLGEHGDLDVNTKAAHLLKIGGKTLLCAADSNNLEPRLYSLIHDMVGKLDILFIGMECQGAPMSWLYGPLFTRPIVRKDDQSRRLDGSDCEKALRIVSELRPTQVYVYAMGAEPWLSFISSIQYTEQSKPIVESDKLVAECQRRGIQSERLLGKKEIPLSG